MVRRNWIGYGSDEYSALILGDTCLYAGDFDDGRGYALWISKVDPSTQNSQRTDMILAGVATPKKANDAANKEYVDALVREQLGVIENGSY